MDQLPALPVQQLVSLAVTLACVVTLAGVAAWGFLATWRDVQAWRRHVRRRGPRRRVPLI